MSQLTRDHMCKSEKSKYLSNSSSVGVLVLEGCNIVERRVMLNNKTMFHRKSFIVFA